MDNRGIVTQKFLTPSAESISLLSSGKTQQQVAEEVGKDRSLIARYRALADIDKRAWEIVTTITQKVTVDENGLVTNNVTMDTFNERLLRDITSLNPCQQIELVSRIAKGNNYKKAN